MLTFSRFVGLGLIVALAIAGLVYGVVPLLIGLIVFTFLLVSRRGKSTTNTPEERRQRRARLVVLAALALGIVLNIVAISKAAYMNQSIATAMLGIAIYPAWHYYRHNEDNVPILPVFSFIYWVAFGLQVFVPLPHAALYEKVRYEEITYSLGLATIALAVFLAAFYLFSGRLFRGIPKIPDAWSVHKAKAIGWPLAMGGVLITIGITLRVFPSTDYLKPILTFVVTLSLLGTGTLFLLFLQGQLGSGERWFFWMGLVPLHLALWWGESGGGPAALFVMVIALIHFRRRLKVPLLPAATIVLAVVSLIAFRPELRGLSSYAVDFERERYDVVGRVNNFLTVNLDFYERFSTKELQERTASVINRLDQLSTFAYVVQETPEVVPYWHGETYKNFVWKIVPRPLFSDKPSDNLASSFPRRYNVADPSVLTQTTIPMPLLAEFYANYGVMGILVGMVLLGLVFRIIYQVFNSPGVNGWACVAAAVMGAPLITGMGANFSLVYGGLVLPTIAIFIIGAFVSKRATSEAQRPRPGLSQRASPARQ